MSYATTLDEVLALRSENFHLRDRLSLARKECAIMRDMLLNPDPESEPDVVRLHREKCDEITKRIEAETELAALRASAVAEPVAIVHQINGPFASPVAHPAPAAPTPIMQAAAKAAKTVAGWSDAKREYADRVTGAPAVAPTREYVAPLQHIIEGIIIRRVFEKRIEGYTLETSAEIADAILALKAAPAKPHHVALGSDIEDGQRGKERE